MEQNKRAEACISWLTLIFISGQFLSSNVFAESARDFVTDRPGATDTPKTMTKGHSRLEMSLFNYEHWSGRLSDDLLQISTFLSFFAVRGVTEDSEIQAGIDGYKAIKTERGSDQGLGIAQFRYKKNLIGNDDGLWTISIMPVFGYTGTSSGARLSAGFQAPILYTFTESLSVCAMPTLYHYAPGITQYLVPIVWNYTLSESTQAFVQSISAFWDPFGTPTLYGLGVAYLPKPTLQFDLELNYGKNDLIQDWILITGVVIGF